MRVTAVLLLAACAGSGPIVETTAEPLVLFPQGATPAQTNVDQGYDVEIGIEVWSDVGGTVGGVRFYKGSVDTGVHVGHLWSAGGQLLATALFTGETANGWQEARFHPPVPIAAGAHVIASYHTTTGFSWTEGYYSTQRDASPLHVPAGGGVYAWGPSRDPIFPSQRYANSSYWVDVDFRPPPSGATSRLYDAADASPTTEIASSAAHELGVRFQSDVDGALHGVRFYKTAHDTGTHVVHVWDASGALVATAGSQEESASGWQDVPIAVQLAAGRTYVASYSTSSSFPAAEHAFDAPRDRPPLHALAGVFANGAGFPEQTYASSSYFVDVDFEANGCAPACAACGADDGCGGVCCAPGRHTIWTPAEGPTTPGYAGPEAQELGTRFTVAAPGRIRAIRYFKDAAATASTAGHLWDDAGNLLATVAISPGTASGWQEAPLAAPLVLVPGRTYVASVSIAHGFAYTADYFDAFGHGAPPLVAPVAAGVFGAPGSFPTQSWAGSSYWVDVVFDPDPPELSLFPSWLVPEMPQLATSTPFELGVKFSTATAGSITHLRFYKGAGRSEERRVGKECRSRWSPYH